MIENVATFIDSDILTSGPALILAGVIGFGFWLLQRSISAADRRQEADRREVREQGKPLADHEVRITVVEKVDSVKNHRNRGTSDS